MRLKIKEWLSQGVEATETENTYTPPKKTMVCVARTVYPNEQNEPIFSPNGTGEFYGIVETKKEEI